MSRRSTRSRIPLKPVYRPEDVAALGYDEALGDPGVFPYTRGRRPPDHAAAPWIQRELSGEGAPSQSNAQLKYLIEKGATGLDVIGGQAGLSRSAQRFSSIDGACRQGRRLRRSRGL